MFGFKSATPRMTAQQAVTRAQTGEIQVIDVRDHGEVQLTGKAKEAIVIPLAVIPFQCDPKGPDFNTALDPSKPIALYCASGARSAMAATILKKLGYKEVHNIGGLGHWQQAGGDVTP